METAESGGQEAYSSILCEFLEVAIHLILYVREVYPPAFFQRRRKYNIPVHISIHPELNQYIRDVLEGLKPLLEVGQVEMIAVLIRDKVNRPTEKFVFKINKEEGNLREDSYLLGLEADLRSLLLKINVCDALLRPNPPDCTFIVLVYTNQKASAEAEHEQQSKEFPWVAVECGKEPVCPGECVIPLRSVSNNLLKMQLHVEESVEKPRTTTM